MPQSHRSKHNPTPITPKTAFKLDDGTTSISNYFPARALRKPIYPSDNFWQTRIITAQEINCDKSILNIEECPQESPIRDISGLSKKNYLTPNDSPRDISGIINDPACKNVRKVMDSGFTTVCKNAAHVTLNEQEILKITSLELPEDVTNLNLSGQVYNHIDKTNFSKFKNCKFVQASQTVNINLDSFESFEQLEDLELNMSSISQLTIPVLKNLKTEWNLSVLDLSFNKLGEATCQNISILSNIPKLRVLNLSGNDLSNLGNQNFNSFPNLELFVAESNNLSQSVFYEMATLFPKIKVLVLNKNKIQNIPKIDSENSPNTNLKILSLINNPISKFENFSNILQYSNLQILKLQNTPFVKNTSKNPKVVDESTILVERHFKNAKNSKQIDQNKLEKYKKFRKVAEPLRLKRDKRWFIKLIDELENRVKFEVREAILGEGDTKSENLETKSQKVENEENDDDVEKVFLTELDLEKTELDSTTSSITINDRMSTISEISNTITDMSVLNTSISENDSSINIKISDTVSRLRSMLNKNSLSTKALSKENFGPSLINLDKEVPKTKKFLYQGLSKIETKNHAKLKNLTTVDNHTTGKIVEKTLEDLQNFEGQRVDLMNVDDKVDAELFSNLKEEYEILRKAVNES